MRSRCRSTKYGRGDVQDHLDELDPNSVDACFCDPPYGLDFRGNDWDKTVPGSSVWSKVYEVLKPGAHLVAFGGTRTYHHLALAIEQSGFEIRDCLMWLYGSGMPKSQNVGKLLEKHESESKDFVASLAESFKGYRTSLKPAWEPAVMAMKPYEKSYAHNAIEHGLAGLNEEGSRIGEDVVKTWDVFLSTKGDGIKLGGGWKGDVDTSYRVGRYPTNVLTDEQVRQDLYPKAHNAKDQYYYYCSKPTKKEKDAGLVEVDEKTGRLNIHPCVKPIDLCEHISSLLLPPPLEGRIRTILIPFSGSGSEMIGAIKAGWDRVIGIEIEEEYAKIAEQRLAYWCSEE